MAKTIKYYSFVDLVTGTMSKDLGWEETKEGQSIEIREVKGKLTITKDEVTSLALKRVPNGSRLKELTKEEYDKLDVSGEHPYLTQKRERTEKSLEEKPKSAEQDYAELARGDRKIDAKALLKQLKR